MSEQNYARTDYEARLDIDYAVLLAELHERLFGRIKKLVTLASLVAGSTAFTGVLAKMPAVAAAASLFVALVSALDLVFDFGTMAVNHQRNKQEFLALRGRCGKLSLDTIDAEIARIKASCATTIEALELPAYNDNLRRHGRIEHLAQLSRWQRLVRLLA